MIVADYHMHSHYSGDCDNDLEAIVQTAIKKGLKEIAITDHGPGHMGYGIKVKHYQTLRKEVDALNEKYEDINVLLGIELNIMSPKGDCDVTDEIRELADILLMGYHFASRPSNVSAFFMHVNNGLYKVFKGIKKHAMKANTKAYVNAIAKNNVNILTHPGAKGPVDMSAVAKACEEHQVKMEINASGHGHLTVEEIKEAMQFDVEFVIDSDAHTLDRIADVESSIARAKEAGLDFSRIVNWDRTIFSAKE